MFLVCLFLKVKKKAENEKGLRCFKVELNKETEQRMRKFHVKRQKNFKS